MDNKAKRKRQWYYDQKLLKKPGPKYVVLGAYVLDGFSIAANAQGMDCVGAWECDELRCQLHNAVHNDGCTSNIGACTNESICDNKTALKKWRHVAPQMRTNGVVRGSVWLLLC